MTARIFEICKNIPPCDTLADIGCDHGYCTKYALEHGVCERAYISDISAGSLAKAERLLKSEMERGVCMSVVADGMRGVGDIDCVLIAGLGGEEIVRILSERELPARFVLQPMRNSCKVRAFLLERGAHIERDYTFGDGGYFYDLISGTGAGGDSYSDFEIYFGRENLTKRPQAFVTQMHLEHEKVKQRLSRKMSVKSRRELLKKLNILEVVTNALDDDI